MNRPHGRCRLFHCVSYLPLPSPSRSNTIIGCSPRLKTKTLSFLSTPTPPISLNDQPGGSFAQFSIGSYEYAPLPTVAMPRLLCSLPVGKLVTKQKVRPGTRGDAGVEC